MRDFPLIAHRAVLSIVLPSVAFITALSGGNMPAMARAEQPPPLKTFVGRWKEKPVDMDSPAYTGETASKSLGMLDIVVCGAQVCGVQINADGTCGATVLRFNTQPAGFMIGPDMIYEGQMSGRYKFTYANLEPSEQSGDQSIEITAGNGNISPLSRTAAMPAYNRKFERAGPAKCAARP